MKSTYLQLILLMVAQLAVAQKKPTKPTQQPQMPEPDMALVCPAREPAMRHPKEVQLQSPRRQRTVGNVKGIDVSHYQGRINWFSVRSDEHSDYAYLKCTENSSLVDETFEYNLRMCREAGIPVGAYHFFSPTASPFAQIQNLLTALPNLRQCDLVPMIDVEARGKCSLPEFRDRLRQFLSEVERAYGVKPIIYTGVNFYKKYLDGYFDSYLFMIARYADEMPDMPENLKFAMWQFSQHGHTAGIRGSVDLSCFVNGYSLKDIMVKR
ncbi:MAG: glycosyl hydrolase family 25 [Bacteroidaceae bacterium]|nr:glycosyl hydrolase family 25 [Bacteroidaceae bacterium]